MSGRVFAARATADRAARTMTAAADSRWAPAVTVNDNALGDFLRARRAQVRPEQVGLATGMRRRAPGLRREELAMLAGISAEYYLRLERGRAQNPSPQVLEGLARALRLEAAATRHLHELANPTASDVSDVDASADGLADVIDQLLVPAIVANRYQEVLAANPIARALSPEFAPGTNFLRWRLLDPAARELYVMWDEATASTVGGLRDLAGPCPKDQRMRALIAEMSAVSPRFRELWCRGQVGYGAGMNLIRHPLVGELRLYCSRLNAPFPGGQHVLMFHAEPRSKSSRALAELRRHAGRQVHDLAAAG